MIPTAYGAFMMSTSLLIVLNTLSVYECRLQYRKCVVNTNIFCYRKDMDGLRATGEQLIEAVAYGDAAGLPVETMCREEIQAKYGWLGNLVAPTDNPFYPGNHEPGVWSDDTELTMAVAQGLLDADGFELEAQAETHL